jgi:transposase
MRYAERMYTKRIDYLRELRTHVANKGSKNIVYLDESGFDQSQNYRHSGWAKIGQKIYGERSGKRWLRTSLLMAQVGKKWLAPMLFGGTCNTKVFNAWLEEMLLPELPPNQTIVMDNAAIHKSQKTREILENAGHEVLFLPPYSPDFNPIEQSFGILKRRLNYAQKGTTLDDLLCATC